MSTTNNKRTETAIETAEEMAEKQLVANILHHIGFMLIAKSPFRTKVQQDAEGYKTAFLSSRSKEDRKPFVQTRDIIFKMVELLVKSPDRTTLGKMTAYLKTLQEDRVVFVADPEIDVRQKLADYLKQEFDVTVQAEQLDNLINIAYGLTTEDDQNLDETSDE
ncbi:hypothetical protein [Spirosoma oryzicola]|uniref:hypothetical protein n=1 Tax=Spirosoma oryzicola TaxID=2898794 RepID=UPI001E3622C9|nr:hypothetical protein [Spirosoma oryzicola]UHG90092.1 hypothetical protein LQ777_17790 [Spirosoma oryzicola]